VEDTGACPVSNGANMEDVGDDSDKDPKDGKGVRGGDHIFRGTPGHLSMPHPFHCIGI